MPSTPPWEAELPRFLDLPVRSRKPRVSGVTHVLDKGLPPASAEALVEQAAHLVDVVKVGWGIGYVDPTLRRRVAIYREAGLRVSLGGTLLEVAAAQGCVDALARWAIDVGIDTVEVSDGLCALGAEAKTGLVRRLTGDFLVLAETGAKDAATPVLPAVWAQQMLADLEAGATWVIAEGRESGTVGLYSGDGGVRDDLVDELVMRVPVQRIIFEAPTKAQQVWFVRRLGPEVNLGNVAPEEVLPLETLRLGLRADTAQAAPVATGTPVLPT